MFSSTLPQIPWLGMVAHAYNSNTQETRESGVQCQLGLPKTLSHENKTVQIRWNQLSSYDQSIVYFSLYPSLPSPIFPMTSLDFASSPRVWQLMLW